MVAIELAEEEEMDGHLFSVRVLVCRARRALGLELVLGLRV